MEADIVYGGEWNKGHTSIVPMLINDNLYILSFDQAEGKAVVSKVTGLKAQAPIEGLWWGVWNNDQSEFSVFEHQGTNYLSRYKPEHKILQVLRYSESRKEIVTDRTFNLNAIEGKGTSTVLNGQPFWVAVDGDSVSINRLDPSLPTLHEAWKGKWQNQK